MEVKNLDIFLIDYEIYKVNPNWWLEIIKIFLKPGLRFKVSIEKDSTDLLEKLCNYNSKLEINHEKDHTNVKVVLNKEMIRCFMENYRVKSIDNIDYYSPFFTLEISDKYCSAHYGSELYLTDLKDFEFDKVMKVINPLIEYVKVDLS